MIKDLYRLLVVFILFMLETVTHKEYNRLYSYREGFRHGVMTPNAYFRTGRSHFVDYYLLGHERGKKFADKKGR